MQYTSVSMVGNKFHTDEFSHPLEWTKLCDSIFGLYWSILIDEDGKIVNQYFDKINKKQKKSEPNIGALYNVSQSDNQTLRRVEVFTNTKTGKEFFAIAKFHCWGASFEEPPGGTGNCSMAIVELQNGQIMLVYPDLIRFIN